VLAVPFYAVARWVGAEPATVLRPEENLGVWWVTLWSSLVPFIALLALAYLLTRPFGEGAALAAAVGVGFGTIVLPFSVQLYGHVIAAALAFGAWFLVRDPGAGARRLALGGLLAGWAVATEYPAALVVAVVSAGALWLHRRRVGWYALGALPGAALLAWYHWRAFGAPWRVPQDYYLGRHGYAGADIIGYDFPPPLDGLLEVLVRERGLVLVSPIVLLGLVAALRAVRRRDAWQPDMAVAVAVVVASIVLAAGWAGTPFLEEPGPRYLVPAIPFVAVPVAAAYSRWRSLVLAAVGVGVVVNLLPTAVPFLLAHQEFPVQVYVDRLGNGEHVETLWTMAMGGAAGVAAHAVTTVALLAALASRRLSGRG
jgi:hypothetical protein